MMRQVEYVVVRFSHPGPPNPTIVVSPRFTTEANAVCAAEKIDSRLNPCVVPITHKEQ